MTDQVWNNWQTEQQYANYLHGIYNANAMQLNCLFANLPQSIRGDLNVQMIFALCFLRLSDTAGAKAINSLFFAVDDQSLFSAAFTHRAARGMLKLYKHGLKTFYQPLARLVNWRFRHLSDAQLLLNMYLKVWSNNSLGLCYIFPLFCRAIVRQPSPDTKRNICFFVYIAALNCLLDDGIAVMEREIDSLKEHAGAHPFAFWLQEMEMLLAMCYFYNLEYKKADQLHQVVEGLDNDADRFLFVRTMNYGSWLRLAASTHDASKFEAVSLKLQRILQSDYDRRFALRTHSYRALIAARRLDSQRCLQELALANSIADRNPWGLEFCNHFGVRAKIYLYQQLYAEALNQAEIYVKSLKATSFQSSFVWEANLLWLKCLILNHALVPRAYQNHADWQRIEREIKVNLGPYVADSGPWRLHYLALRGLLRAAKTEQIEPMRRRVSEAQDSYPGSYDELESILAVNTEQQPANRSFALNCDQATEALRLNRELINYIEALRRKSFVELDSFQIMELSEPLFSTIFGAFSFQPPASFGQEYLPPYDAVITTGISEFSKAGSLYLIVEIQVENNKKPLEIVVKDYKNALNFRRDLLSSLVLWKEATENAAREKLLLVGELEREKSLAITRTTQMLAHDVRKPFSMIKAMLTMLLHGVDRQVLLKFRHEVLIAIDSVNGMLADIMEIGAASHKKHDASSPLRRALLSALGQNVAQMQKADIELCYEFGHAYQAAIEESKLIRVLSNILANAVQAMHGKGRIAITSRESENQLEITIHNSDSYIASEHIGRVFDSFFTHGKSGGTGLGLAIVSNIINACGGSIACSSTIGDGTSFVARLPKAIKIDSAVDTLLPEHSSQILRPVSMDDYSEHKALMVAGLSNELQQAIGLANRPIRILMCDDEELYAETLRSQLEAWLGLSGKMIFEACTSSSLALDRARRARYDLAILDIDLGESSESGLHLSRSLRGLQPDAIICIHSNRDLSNNLNELDQSGANLFLAKPIQSIHFLKMLLTALNKTQERSWAHPGAQQSPINGEHSLC